MIKPILRLSLIIPALLTAGSVAAEPARVTPVPLPSGTIGAGFDDLNYSSDLNRVLVPAARTGRLFLLDPATGAMDAVEGFGTEPPPGGHGGGSTSSDAGGGFVFAIDRTTRTLKAVDPAARKIVASVPLEGAPDIVRFVAPRGEVWVTEPHDRRIEIFNFKAGGVPMLAHAGEIPVPEEAPEALQVDAARNRLYTNQESGTTFAIDLESRQIVERWPLGCGPTGLALDAKSGFLFVACEEAGEIIVLDVVHHGRELARLAVGAGIDLIAYSPSLRHLYIPSSKVRSLEIVGVSAGGKLSLLDTIPTAERAHCGTTDDHGNVWVCDPTHGQLLLVKDRFPATR